MITNSTQPTQSALLTSVPAQNTSVVSDPAISSDFETFLKMLTAQARYQDPLEPIDSTEFASQLAQFSMVEQQVKTNENLGSLLAQLGSQNAASLSAWVGAEVRVETSVSFEGEPVMISPSPVASADKAYLLVTGEAGAVVQRLQIPVSEAPFIWNGTDSDGVGLENGDYSFSVESYAKGESLGTSPAQVYLGVVEAQIEADEVVLLLKGGQRVPAQSVSALRE